MDELYKLAGEFLSMSILRDKANAVEDYAAAFEIECTQRDTGDQMVEIIYKLYNNKEK